MLNRTDDAKKPAGSTNPPAGRTDSADFTSSAIKTIIISFVLGLVISSCSPVHAGADAREIDAQAWRAWHRNQMQPNQPQTRTQQAQAASKSVAKEGGRHE